MEMRNYSDNSTNSPWAYIGEGLLSEGLVRLRFEGLIFGRAYYLFFFLEGEGGLVIGILRYLRTAKICLLCPRKPTNNGLFLLTIAINISMLKLLSRVFGCR